LPDITMCTKTQCPKAIECYRIRAMPDNHYQSFSNFTGMCNSEDDFQMFMNIRVDDKIRDCVEPKEIETSEENANLLKNESQSLGIPEP